MSTNYGGNPLLFPALFPIPDDGDLDRAAAFNPAYEALGDRTAYLLAAMPGLTAGDEYQLPLFHGMSDTYVDPATGLPYTVWRRNAAVFSASIQQASNVSTPEVSIVWDIIQMPKREIVGVRAYLQGAAGHAAFPGGAPGTMPGIALYRVNSTGTPTLLGGTVDSSATAALYESSHPIDITLGAPYHYNPSNRLFLILAGEDGVNFLPELACHQIIVYVDPM